MATLLLRLSGPMQSWGIQSHFPNRDTGLEPSKSGVIGLLCAALGRSRGDDIADLAELKMGVRVDWPGVIEHDYHTAGGTHRKGDKYGVAKAGGGIKDCEPSDRFYLADACFLVALQGDGKLLEQLHQALAHPVWQLNLGRKAFVPGEPVYLKDGLLPATDNLDEALYYPYLCPTRRDLPGELRLELQVDNAKDGDRAKPDQPISFAERRFGLRYVKTSSLRRKELPLPKEAPCI